MWESNPCPAALLVHVLARPQNPRLHAAAAAADGRRGGRQTGGGHAGPGRRPLQVRRPLLSQRFNLTQLPTILCPLQRRDRPDRLLHRHDDRLPAAGPGGDGGRPEHHLPAPSRQVRTLSANPPRGVLQSDPVFFVCRGGMIQTGEQYQFVHHALSLYDPHVSAEMGQ